MKIIIKKQIGIVIAIASLTGFYAFTENAIQGTSEFRMVSFQDTSKNKPKLSVEEKNSDVFQVVDVMPEYPGGEEAMMKFIVMNFVYPDSAKKNNIQGLVMIQFIVNEDGSISDVKALLPKEKQIGYGLEEEAIRVVSAMPNWKPGTQRGKAVKVQYVLPVNCQLSR